MRITKGQAFGPHHRFRIDLYQEDHSWWDGTCLRPGTVFVAKGLDAEKPSVDDWASVFTEAIHQNPNEAFIRCQRQIEASAEWLDACTIDED